MHFARKRNPDESEHSSHTFVATDCCPVTRTNAHKLTDASKWLHNKTCQTAGLQSSNPRQCLSHKQRTDAISLSHVHILPPLAMNFFVCAHFWRCETKLKNNASYAMSFTAWHIQMLTSNHIRYAYYVSRQHRDRTILSARRN